MLHEAELILSTSSILFGQVVQLLDKKMLDNNIFEMNLDKNYILKSVMDTIQISKFQADLLGLKFRFSGIKKILNLFLTNSECNKYF